MDKNKVAVCKRGLKIYFMDSLTGNFYVSTESTKDNSSLLIFVILIANPIISIINSAYAPVATTERNLIFLIALSIIVWSIARIVSLNTKKNPLRVILLTGTEKQSLFEEGNKKIKVEATVYIFSILSMLIFSLLFFTYSNLIFLVLGMDCSFVFFLGMRSDFVTRYKVLKKNRGI